MKENVINIEPYLKHKKKGLEEELKVQDREYKRKILRVKKRSEKRKGEK